MASTTVQVRGLPNLGVMTLLLYPRNGGTAVNGSGDVLAEHVDTPGLYQATVSEALTGVYSANIIRMEHMIGSFLVDLQDDDGTYELSDTSTLLSRVDANITHISGVSAEPFSAAVAAIGYGTVGDEATTSTIPIKTINQSPVSVDQLKGRILLFPASAGSVALQAAEIVAVTLEPLTLTVTTLTSVPSEDTAFVIQ